MDSPLISFDLLPDETIMNILLAVDDFETLVNWCQTSKRINNICQDNVFWKRKYQQDYHNMPSLPKMTWKEKYKFNYSARYSSPISIGMGIFRGVRMGSHYGIIDDKGVLSMAGINHYGQLGNNNTIDVDVNKPTVVKFEPKQKIISISCGTNITGAVTENGNIYVWGKIFSGNLTIKPLKITLPDQKKAIKITVKGTSIAIITSDLEIYVYIIEKYNISKPIKLLPVKKLSMWVVDFVFGENTYAVITTEGKILMGGKIWHQLRTVHGWVYIESREPIKQITLGDKYIAGLSIYGKSGEG